MSLFREHLEEAAFLHEHRRRMLASDSGVDLFRLAELEQRFEAHIDALVLGGSLAQRSCVERAAGGDFGELTAALRVFCRTDERRLAVDTIESADLEDPAVRQAIEEALVQEFPRPWAAILADWLGRPNSPLAELAARVLGTNRWQEHVDLLHVAALRSGNHAVFAWSFGRLGLRSSAPLLESWLEDERPEVSTAAAVALLRLHAPNAVARVYQRFGRGRWLVTTLAVACGRELLAPLRQVIAGGDPDAYVALGLLGDVSAVDTLFTGLENPATHEAAALGLLVLTGVGAHDGPDRTERWQAWWKEHSAKFASGVRHRFGRPASVQANATALLSPMLPSSVRQLIIDEVAIRYGFAPPLEHDMVVHRQLAQLRAMAEDPRPGLETAGRWCYAGRVLG